MPTLKFALDRGGPKRVELSWTGMWKDASVSLDGEVLGTIEGKAALQQGRSFTLPDGTTLRVVLAQGFANTELQLTRDGAPLPGSPSDPEERVRQAAYMVWAIGGLSTVVGLVAVLFSVKLLMDLGLGWTSVAAGALYGALGYFTWRRSRVALILAIVLFVIDGIAGVAMSVGAGGSPSVGGLIMRVFLLLPMIRGVGAAGELARRSRGEAGAAS